MRRQSSDQVAKNYMNMHIYCICCCIVLLFSIFRFRIILMCYAYTDTATAMYYLSSLPSFVVEYTCIFNKLKKNYYVRTQNHRFDALFIFIQKRNARSTRAARVNNNKWNLKFIHIFYTYMYVYMMVSTLLHHIFRVNCSKTIEKYGVIITWKWSFVIFKIDNNENKS